MTDPILGALLANGGTIRAQFTAEAERLQRIHETLAWLARILTGRDAGFDPLATLRVLVPKLSPSAAGTVMMWVDE